MSVDQGFEVSAVQSLLADPGDPAERTREKAHSRLLAAIEAENSHASVRYPSIATTPARNRRIRRLLPVATLATAAAAAAIALLISQVLVHGGAVQPQSAAAAVLQRAADAALASPPAQVGPHQYWYEENQGTYLDAVGTAHGVLSADVSQVARYWIGTERWQRQDRLVSVRAVGPITEKWQRSALAQLGANPSLTGTGQSFDLPVTYDQLLNAPTQLTALARFVAPSARNRGGLDDTTLFTGIHDILIEPMVPARLQARLFRLAATIPGVHALGLTRDTLGRGGLAVGFTDRVHRVLAEFIFDPVSYALLDYRETALTSFGPGIPAGTVTQETAFIRAGLVHHAPSSCTSCIAVGPNP